MASIYKRGKTFWVKYYLDGQMVRESLKTKDPAKAEKMRVAKELEVEDGKAATPLEVMTLDRFLKAFELHYVNAGSPALRESRDRSWKADRRHILRHTIRNGSPRSPGDPCVLWLVD
ncbi:hypothetical protein ACFL59_09835 [Planctomycetota bacterium]